MTNEDMMREYLAGNTEIIADIYVNVAAFIKSIAVSVATRFDCTDWDLIDELFSHGRVAFFEIISKNEYDVRKGMLTTYLKPHIEGSMIRLIKRHFSDTTNVTSIHDNFIEDKDGTAYSFYDYYEDDRIVPPHLIVYRKICVELLEEIFNSLSRKEKTIIGKSYGVYGYPKTSLEDIALEQIMKVDGVIKARNKAIEKIRHDYEGSKLQIWRRVWRLVNKSARF